MSGAAEVTKRAQSNETTAQMLSLGGLPDASATLVVATAIKSGQLLVSFSLARVLLATEFEYRGAGAE